MNVYFLTRDIMEREKCIACSKIKNLRHFQQKSYCVFDTYLFGLMMACWGELLLLTEKSEISRIFEKD